MDVCARTSAVSFCARGHASPQTRQRRRRAARGSSQYAADGARRSVSTDSSGLWKQRRWRRRMGRQGGSLRGPCVPSASSVARRPLETRNRRHKTGTKREINLFVRLFGRVSVLLRGPGLVCLLFFLFTGKGGGARGGGSQDPVPELRGWQARQDRNRHGSPQLVPGCRHQLGQVPLRLLLPSAGGQARHGKSWERGPARRPRGAVVNGVNGIRALR